MGPDVRGLKPSVEMERKPRLMLLPYDRILQTREAYISVLLWVDV